MTDEINKSFRYNGAMEGNRYQSEQHRKAKPEQRLGMTRRGFLAFGGTVALAAYTGPTIYKNWPTPEADQSPRKVETDAVTPEPMAEEKEVLVTSEAFMRSVEKYRLLQTIDRASVFFTMADGRIIGEPVPFEDFIVQRGTRINKEGQEEPFFYNLTPANKDESGQYIVESIPREWTDYVKELHATQYAVTAEELEQEHITADFLAALKQDDEPELIAGIEAGTIRTKMDIVNYFIAKDFKNSNGENRVEYIKNHVTFSGNLEKAPYVTAALRELLPGLVAVESGYDNEVVSNVGAKGSFQFMPNTWHRELNRVKFIDGEELPFAEQVAAAGELFSKMYDRLQYWCYEGENYYGQNYLEEIKAVFTSQQDFETHFFVPCLINAYNTGEQGIGEVVVAFGQSAEFRNIKEQGNVHGYDLFQSMCDFGRASELSQLADYKEEAPKYVQRVYAFAELLSEGVDETRVANL